MIVCVIRSGGQQYVSTKGDCTLTISFFPLYIRVFRRKSLLMTSSDDSAVVRRMDKPYWTAILDFLFENGQKPHTVQIVISTQMIITVTYFFRLRTEIHNVRPRESKSLQSVQLAGSRANKEPGRFWSVFFITLFV